MKKKSKELLKRIRRERLFFDGGTGTILQEMGLSAGEFPESWNLSHPDWIMALHRGYLEAGCNIFNTNTFGANSLKFPDQLDEIVRAGVRLAKQARTDAGREDAYIALDIGPSGKLLEPMGDLSFEDAVSLFAEIVRSGADEGADLILIETMADSLEAKAAVLAAKENCDLPVFITMVFDESQKMLTGGTPESMTAMLEGLHVDALGVNCSLGPEQMKPIVKRFLTAASVPVLVNPNAGLPKQINGKTAYDIGPDQFARLMKDLVELGAHSVGGCCGTTPEHIRKMIAAVSSLPFEAPVEKHRSVISSFSETVEIGKRPVIIGERINPTGKKKFKAALKNHDIEYILQEGLQQEDAGADVLDVNVGLPEIDEQEMLTEVVKRLQGITSLPLQIDTSDVTAMEEALRSYNGKPMINSVNGKEENMRQVFPLVQKYGGVVVALLLDEDGIPATAEGRVRIAEKIYRTAGQYGIRKEDIVVDALAMTISSDSTSALTTLESLRRIRNDLHGHTILGVSNVSFGLPARALINANFFTMALQNGLSCAIINPNNELMMSSYRSFLALTSQDPQCMDFIRTYGDMKIPAKLSGFTVGPAPSPAPSPASSGADSSEKDHLSVLQEAVLHGMQQQAETETRRELDVIKKDPMEIINSELIPALDLVGKEFEKGTLFLPQLLMSAEAAKAAFAIVKESLSEASDEKKEKVILATVKGDIHDIGKNIVKVLMENYGYDVMDLGRDVAPELIVETARKNHVRLVGLSALMTTTVVNMEETIRQLHDRLPEVKIVVGGAVMNKEYAEQIGADCYARDAMATVRYADQLFASE